MKKCLKLSSFWLRLVAIITMTIDHIGVMLSSNDFIVFRIIGRLALPLFIFMTVEGALKTSNSKKYIFRLSLFTLSAAIVLTVLSFTGGFYEAIAYSSGNIFLDLLLIVVAITIFESKNNKIKPLGVLPILYLIFSGIVLKLEGSTNNGLFKWFVPGIRCQYGYYTALLGIGFYLASKLAPKISPLCSDDDTRCIVTNILSVLALIFSTVLLFFINITFFPRYKNGLDEIQIYAIFSGLFIFFYNGQKGYNAKWFKIGYYLYYPIHLVIIVLIFTLFGS